MTHGASYTESSLGQMYLLTYGKFTTFLSEHGGQLQLICQNQSFHFKEKLPAVMLEEHFFKILTGAVFLILQPSSVFASADAYSSPKLQKTVLSVFHFAFPKLAAMKWTRIQLI